MTRIIHCPRCTTYSASATTDLHVIEAIEDHLVTHPVLTIPSPDPAEARGEDQ